MEDNFLINKFLEDLTPRRAIAKFAVIATPIESPDPSTLFQLPQKRPVLKKFEQIGANVSKRSTAESPHSELLDSILNNSMPSEVESPNSVDIPRHRLNQRRISTSHLFASFSQAIESQKSQPSTAAAGNSFIDDSLPYELHSPVLINNPRFHPKKKVSESIFKKAFEGLQIESDGSLSGPSTLETPVQVKQSKTKKKPKISSSRFDQVLEEIAITSVEKLPPQKEKFEANQHRSGSPASNMTQNESDNSLSGPSTLETPEQVKQPIRKDTRSRVSSAEFMKVLEEKAIASDKEVPTLQEKSRAKARQSGSSGSKTPPSNKIREPNSSSPSSPVIVNKFKGGVSSKRTPAKSPAMNGASGRKSLPQTAGPSNTTVSPLEASGKWEFQQQAKSRVKARQSGSSLDHRKTPSSNKILESDSSLLFSPEQEKRPKGKDIKLRASLKVSEKKAVDSDDELLSSQNEKSAPSNRRSKSTGRETPLSNKSSSSVDTPEQVKQLKTKKNTRMSQKILEEVHEVVEELAIPKNASVASKRKTGSTGRRTPLSNITNKSQYKSDGSLSGPSSLDTPEQVEPPKAKMTRRVSSSQFRLALEEKAKEPKVATESDANQSTRQNPPFVRETLLHKLRTSFVQSEASSTSSRESASSSKTVSTERSAFKRVYGNAANMEETTESPSATKKNTWFVPFLSFTHVPKTALEEDFEEEEEESSAQTANFTQKSPPVEGASDAVSLSSSGLPAELDSSPELAVIPRRYKKSSAKNRPFMTECLAALGPRNTPPKPKTPADGVSPQRTPVKSPAMNGVSARTSLPQTVGPSNNMGTPLEALGKRESLSVSNRTRSSHEFNINDPEEQDIMSNMQFLEDDPINVHVDPPSTDDDSDENGEGATSSGEEDSVKEEEEEVQVLFGGQSPPNGFIILALFYIGFLSAFNNFFL